MVTVENLSIGQLAVRTGTKVQTIRYYEQVGLMPEPGRTAGNQRRYSQEHLDRLGFIRHGRELGFSLGDIQELLSLATQPEESCAQADRIARHHLAQVESRIRRLEALKEELAAMVTACAGNDVRHCHILGVLSDHSLCLRDHYDPTPPLDPKATMPDGD